MAFDLRHPVPKELQAATGQWEWYQKFSDECSLGELYGSAIAFGLAKVKGKLILLCVLSIALRICVRG